MKQQRSLGQALQLTPDQRSFVSGDQMAQKKPVSIETSLPQSPQREEKHGKHTPVATSQADSISLPTVLVSLTTRLHPDTAETLRQAHLQQKLRRVSPSTQQEIVEAAIRQWLDEHGFTVP